MKYKLKSYNIWELGAREKQEDSIFPEYQKTTDNDRLFILCDGMGGHSAGEVASGTVCEALSASLQSHCSDPEGAFSDDDFMAALSDAYDALDAKDNGAAKKMGTTLTFLKLHDEGCTIAHIGDSRVYHVRPGKDAEDTEILFQTTDHSLVNDLVKIGELTPEEAKHSKQKNIITRAMQPCMERRSRADIYHSSDICPGDYFMLCSDGILEQMEDYNIKYIFSHKGGDAQNKKQMLIDVTKENRDNHSAILVHITEVIGSVAASVPVAETATMKKAVASVKKQSAASVAAKEKASAQSRAKDNIQKLILAIIAIIIMAAASYSAYKYVLGKLPKSEQHVVPAKSVKPVKSAAKPDTKPTQSAPQKTDAPAQETPAPQSAEQPTAVQSAPAQPTIPAINLNLKGDERIPASDTQKATDAIKGNKK